jgi:hypothetical protein
MFPFALFYLICVSSNNFLHYVAAGFMEEMQLTNTHNLHCIFIIYHVSFKDIYIHYIHPHLLQSHTKSIIYCPHQIRVIKSVCMNFLIKN